jgi:ADP-ribose pyrophosphatase
MSARVLHRSRVGTWVSEEVALPNGRRITLETLQHPGAAAVLPFVGPGRVILLRQFRHASGGYLWEVPAGKLEPGEAPEHCAARELEEETGWRARRLVRTGAIFTAPGFTDERIHLFEAHDLERGRLAHEHAEVIEVHEFELARALAMVDSGEIVDAKTLAALFHATRRAPGDGLR